MSRPAAEPLRVGAPDDPFSAPLVWGLDRAPWSDRVVLVRDTPLRLAEALGARALDLALLPPQLYATLVRKAPLEIVPGISITTSGPSEIASLAPGVPLADVRRVATAAEGGAAEALVRLLFAASGQPVEIVARTEAHDAEIVPGPAGGGPAIDLGSAWTDLTGLPMVWALWCARPGFIGRDAYAMLHGARTRGRHARTLAATGPAGVSYRLGRRQLAGLRLFWDSAVRSGLLEASPVVRFVPLASGSACHRMARELGLTQD